MNNLVMGHAMNVAVIDSADTTLEWLSANDGHRIPLRYWPVAKPKAAIQISHGMAEHSGCYGDIAARLNAQGFSVFAHDHRCHGLATQALGDVSPLQHWNGACHDLALVNAEVHQRYPELPVILIGHSMGAFMAQHFAQHYPDQINLLLLEGACFEPRWLTTLGRLIGRFESWRQGPNGRSPAIHALTFGGFNKVFKNPRTDFDWLSRDEGFVDRYVSDPLCGFQTSNAYWSDFVTCLSGLYTPRAMKRIRSDLPLYIFSGDRDPVGHNGRGVERLARAYREIAGCRDVTLRLYPEARHDILHESNQDEVLTDLLGWIKRHLP